MLPRGERFGRRPTAKKSRGRRRRRLRFHFGRALFVLPNLFTLASIFCGFYAVLQASTGASPTSLHRAAVAICFAIFFDLADGRVARLTATESDFGVQLDSLADIVSFGVAPAVLAHAWALGRLGLLGQCLGFGYIACGAMRLARFNVLAARREDVSAFASTTPSVNEQAQVSYFLGLPIPLAAGQLATVVMCAQRYELPFRLERLLAPLLVATLGLLMVSNIRFRTFKDVALTPATGGLASGVLGLFWLLCRTVTPAFGGLCLFGSYVALGLAQGLWRAVGRARQTRAN